MTYADTAQLVFTFSSSGAAINDLAWLGHARPAGAVGWAITVLTLTSVLVAAIGARTIMAIIRGQFLPAAAQSADSRLVTSP